MFVWQTSILLFLHMIDENSNYILWAIGKICSFILWVIAKLRRIFHDCFAKFGTNYQIQNFLVIYPKIFASQHQLHQDATDDFTHSAHELFSFLQEQKIDKRENGFVGKSHLCVIHECLRLIRFFIYDHWTLIKH